MNLQKHPVRKEVERRDETGGQAYDFWLYFIKSQIKTLSTNRQQICGEKNMENIANGSQNGAEHAPKITIMEPKGYQSEPSDATQDLFGNRVEQR